MSGIKSRAWGIAFSQIERQVEAIVPFRNPSPTEPQSWQAGAISEIPLTWLTLFDPSWRSIETLSRPIYRPTQAVFTYD